MSFTFRKGYECVAGTERLNRKPNSISMASMAFLWESRLEKLAVIIERSSPVCHPEAWRREMGQMGHVAPIHISAGHPRLLPVQWLTLSQVCRTLLFLLLTNGPGCVRVNVFLCQCKCLPRLS